MRRVARLVGREVADANYAAGSLQRGEAATNIKHSSGRAARLPAHECIPIWQKPAEPKVCGKIGPFPAFFAETCNRRERSASAPLQLPSLRSKSSTIRVYPTKTSLRNLAALRRMGEA
jgi:hypothetical protein